MQLRKKKTKFERILKFRLKPKRRIPKEVLKEYDESNIIYIILHKDASNPVLSLNIHEVFEKSFQIGW